MWTSNEDEILKSEYKPGHFGLIRQIADKLKRTRNAVIGRANRLGLSREKESWKYLPRSEQEPTHMTDKAKPSTIGLDGQLWTWAANRTHLVDLKPHHCRWPVGLMEFCGGEKYNGSSYCRAHCEHAFTKSQRNLVLPPVFKVGGVR